VVGLSNHGGLLDRLYGSRKELHAGRLLGESKISGLEYLAGFGDAEGGPRLIRTGKVQR
jgi:hypothetical protein